jgi:hypothetical protein
VSTEEPYTLCPDCGERVEPEAPGVHYGVEQREMRTFGPTVEIVDGFGGFFHPGCSPEAVGYVRRPHPMRQ